MGLRYYQITNQGEAIPGTEYEVNDGFTKEGRLFANHQPYANDGGSTWQFEGGGKLAFKKLKGHYELPKPTTVSGFNEHAWVMSAPTR